MPDEFPVQELTLFMASARRVLLLPSKSSAWSEFAGASNLIGWRFRAYSENWNFYRYSISTDRDSGGHEALYRRELSIFVMFSSGVSCIESTAYALAALASHPSILALPFGPTEQRSCSPKMLMEWLRPQSIAAELIRTLDGILKSPEWQLFVDLRNRMTHRSNLPRRVFGSVGTPLPPTKPLNFAPTSSTPSIEADLTEFDRLHTWLAKSVRTLLVAATQFVDAQKPV